VNSFVAATAIIISYFCGTLPIAILIAKSKGVDITTVGSGNPGASNVARAIGKKYGIYVFVGDALKGTLPVAAMLSDRPTAYACAAAAVLGHVFPITRKFKGGKGVATGAGSLLPLHPILLIGAALTWLLMMKISKKASIASIAIVPALVAAFVISGMQAWEIFSLVGIGALVEIRHASNIKRLLSGTEPPVSGSSV
jgi:acyl phosphate:glycerol-3-phosphate acyltransferase